MRSPRILLSSLGVLGCAVCAALAFSQGPPADRGRAVPAVPQRDPQAQALLLQALAAMGGAGAASIQDTVVEATSVPPLGQASPPGTVTIKTKGPNLLRMDGSSAGKTSSTIFASGRELRSTDKG